MPPALVTLPTMAQAVDDVLVARGLRGPVALLARHLARRFDECGDPEYAECLRRCIADLNRE